MFSVAPCEIVSLQLKLDSLVKMGVGQGIRYTVNRRLGPLRCRFTVASWNPNRNRDRNRFPRADKIPGLPSRNSLFPPID
jgi:hypothetical protein